MHPELGELLVGPVAQERVYALRQVVLRPHQPGVVLAVAGADDPEAATMAALTGDGTAVSTACVVPEPPPEVLEGVVPPGRSFRLRAMATAAAARDAGVGAAVLAVATGHVAGCGGSSLWCNARMAAVRFYERAGFRREGEVFEVESIGPHVVMWRPVAPAEGHRPRATAKGHRVEGPPAEGHRAEG